MHQDLSALSKFVVVDTNTLLNACFVADSLDAQALFALKRIGFILIIDNSVEQESRKILTRLKLKYALLFDPLLIFDKFLQDIQMLNLGNTPTIRVAGVNNADQHVASLCRYYAAWLLTNDFKLAAQCQGSGINVRLIWDVLMEAATRNGQDPPLNYIFRAAGLAKNQGSMFARVVLGDWAGMKGIGEFIICHVENVGYMAYDTDNESWNFYFQDECVKIKCSVSPREEWIVCGSYKYPNLSRPGSATIRVGKVYNCDSQTNTINLKKQLLSSNPGKMSLGHSVNGEKHWNGWLKAVVVSPQSMTNDTWKAVIRIPQAAPNPNSDNVLEAALRKIDVNYQTIYIPAQTELAKFWI